jgi:enoyl-CoA hydratase/carnithine racemase
MAIIDYRKEGRTAVVTLNNGENKQDLDFANAMLAAYDAAEADRDISAVVITSSDPKNWSQGVDLNWLMARRQAGDLDQMRSFMYAMNKVFARGLQLPMPVIASITGHAFGNGAMLACSCDFRFMRADRGYFCFPEVDISIPFLPGMVAFCRKAIPEPLFNDLKLTGRRATAEELARHYVVQAALPDAGATFDAAMAFARGVQKSRAIFGEHKRRMHKHIIAVMESEDPGYIEPLNLTV